MAPASLGADADADHESVQALAMNEGQRKKKLCKRAGTSTVSESRRLEVRILSEISRIIGITGELETFGVPLTLLKSVPRY